MPSYDYRDPIYGFITVNDAEQDIIDSRAFQRLRRISQLGPTNFVYPTANHTRFEHSLGTLQSSDELLRERIDRSPGIDVLGWNQQEKSEARTLLRSASLLYDVGHAPFSHAAEDLFPEGLSMKTTPMGLSSSPKSAI